MGSTVCGRRLDLCLHGANTGVDMVEERERSGGVDVLEILVDVERHRGTVEDRDAGEGRHAGLSVPVQGGALLAEAVLDGCRLRLGGVERDVAEDHVGGAAVRECLENSGVACLAGAVLAEEDRESLMWLDDGSRRESVYARDLRYAGQGERLGDLLRCRGCRERALSRELSCVE